MFSGDKDSQRNLIESIDQVVCQVCRAVVDEEDATTWERSEGSEIHTVYTCSKDSCQQKMKSDGWGIDATNQDLFDL